MADHLDSFATMLTRCEAERGNWCTNWEREFLTDMREKFDGREDQIDLGVTAWIPTRNQYNTLHEIWAKL